MPHASAGTTPYGFDFDARGHAIVSEAASGSVSSYDVGRRGFGVISPAVSNTQAAACWLVVARGYAYAVNAASGTVSSYTIAKDGSLALKDASRREHRRRRHGRRALGADQRYLYVRMGGGVVSSWSVGPRRLADRPRDHAGCSGLRDRRARRQLTQTRSVPAVSRT